MAAQTAYQKEYQKTHRSLYVKSVQKYNLSHPEQYLHGIERTKENNRQRRIHVLIHYGGDPPKCACCGESNINFLTIDHINGGGTKHTQQVGPGDTLIRWIVKNDYPNMFQILCYNCNCGRAKHNGICPHKLVEV
jgi:hypothetical protein